MDALITYLTQEHYTWGWSEPRATMFKLAGNPTWAHCEACARETPHLGRCIYAAHHEVRHVFHATPDDAELENMLDNLHVIVTDGVAECSTENTLRNVVQHITKRPLTELSGR